MARHLAHCKLHLELHTHMSTCWKISRLICRLAMGRQIVPNAVQLSEEGPLLLLQRACEMIVPHMDAILLAFGCNNCTTTIYEASHDMALALPSALKTWLNTPEEQRGPCPVRALDTAIDQAYYLVKYIGKDQSDLFIESLLRAAYHLTRGAVGTATPHHTAATTDAAAPQAPAAATAAAAPGPMQPPQPPPTEEHMLKSAIHAVTGQSSHPFAMMAYRLLGHPTALQTWASVPLDPRPFISIVLTGSTTHVIQPYQLAEAGDANPHLRTVRWSDDYIYSNDQLDDLYHGTYVTAMLYQRKGLDIATQVQLRTEQAAQRVNQQPHTPAAPPPPPPQHNDQPDDAADGPDGPPHPPNLQHMLLFQPAHPLYLTHRLAPRRRAVIPRLLGTPPPKPSPDDESTAAQEWYTWSLALFHPFRGRLVVPPQTPKDVWTAYEQRLHDSSVSAEDPSVRVKAANYLDHIRMWQANAAAFVNASIRARTRARVRRADIRRAEREARHPGHDHEGSGNDTQVRRRDTVTPQTG